MVYTGSYKLEDTINEVPLNVGQLVLSPTRTYAPIITKVLQEYRQYIHGMVHCSGGAQTKVLHFINNLHVIKNNLFATPPLFKLIQEESKTSWQEMYKVFNMGHRMEIYLAEEHAEAIIQIANSFNVDAQIIGYVEAADNKMLTIEGKHGTFTY